MSVVVPSDILFSFYHGEAEGSNAVSTVLLLPRCATCDQISAAVWKLKTYIVMQDAESPTIVSIMLKRQASSKPKNKVSSFLRFHGHDDTSRMLTTLDLLVCPVHDKVLLSIATFGKETSTAS